MKLILNKLKWTTRRFNLGIPANALVLEVGSGGNPYPRSNVLVDAHEETRERHWEALVSDRPTVLSFGENLPFKDKVFDFVIAAHVLEHTPYPEQFLKELERVAHAGYIETPDAFMERINPYKDHRLEVTVKNKVLTIQKKTSWIIDEELVELYEKRAKDIISQKTIPGYPSLFHTRYFWKNRINFEILNPDANASWTPPDADTTHNLKLGLKGKIRLLLLRFVRLFFSQNGRNRNLDILPLMKCQKCLSNTVKRKSNKMIVCEKCNSQFKIKKNIFYMVD
ncbi:class I SAM-dependent methyltransferase [Candidatus Levibacter sp. Uisw_134_01]|uniref:class I SAM-dependent methyltransferase n=1 Tax=Candidatus Levibacter sp. Uisw_134_01 TaxID=3230999 RepID=UPI003D501D0E